MALWILRCFVTCTQILNDNNMKANFSIKNNWLWVLLLTVGAMLTRVLPHPPNVTPMTAICLFSGMALGVRFLTFVLPFVVLYASDFLINNTIGRAFIADTSEIIWWTDFMNWTYGSYFLIILASAYFLKKATTRSVILMAFGSGVLFFLLTNFSSWIGFSFYPKTFSGLLLCFEAGIPFFRISIIGDIVFALILFWSYKAVTRPQKSLQTVKEYK